MADLPTLAQRFTAPIRRWLYPDPQLSAASAGRAIQPAMAMYDARNALSAMAAFPWVLACLDVISTDLSGVPLIAVRQDVTGKRTILTDHPVLDLLRRPSPQTGGVAMRRQLYADYAACREAYIRVIGDPTRPGAVALRLHPFDMTPVVDASTGLIEWFQWGAQKLPPAEVLMIRGLGWERGVRSARAVSPIQALQSGLEAAQRARDHAGASAERGQIQFLLKPTDPLAQFGEEGTRRIVEAFDKAAKDGRGVFVLNRALDMQPLTLSPREMEFGKLTTDVRDETWAVFGVPPSVIGGPGANYGTARQEARTYWERLSSIGRLFDDEFSRLTGDPRVRIEHDFTDVEALQSSRTERQQRASVWVQSFGSTPAEAAAYEGFDDAPIDPATTAADVRAPRPTAPTVTEPQEARAYAVVRAWQEAAAIRAAAGDLDPHLEAGVLCAALDAAGCDEPDRRARHAASILTASVRMALDAGAGGEVGTLRVFGPDFARMVAS